MAPPPDNVEVVFEDGHLYAYRPEVIQPIIARAPDAYPGADLFEKIQHATLAGENGELLGYGARSMLEPGTVLVQVVDDAGRDVFSFRSLPENAARALDFSQAYGGRYGWRIAE